MHEPKPAKIRQAVGAAVVGNMLEWYDFAVYAYVAAVVSTAVIWTLKETAFDELA
jgi:hypothetical protein